MKETQVSTNKWMDKEDMIFKYRYTYAYSHIYTMEYYSAIWNSAICINVDKPRILHFVK